MVRIIHRKNDFAREFLRVKYFNIFFFFHRFRTCASHPTPAPNPMQMEISAQSVNAFCACLNLNSFSASYTRQLVLKNNL